VVARNAVVDVRGNATNLVVAIQTITDHTVAKIGRVDAAVGERRCTKTLSSSTIADGHRVG
jgi:hypothetical protein